MDSIKDAIKYLKQVNNVDDFFGLKDFNLFRALMNVTMPNNLSDQFYEIQDQILQEELSKKEIVDVNTLFKNEKQRLTVYQGDITLLNVDAIVNACNEKLLGCFSPLHMCVDNAIHSFAGLQVRRDLIPLMKKQNNFEANGKVKVTKGYNLPSKYIFHTVGPKCLLTITKQNETDLKNCYLSCLNEAKKLNLNSIAFSSISTGVYGYPIESASLIAIKTTIDFLNENKDLNLKVIFDVFSNGDYDVYSKTLSRFNQ